MTNTDRAFCVLSGGAKMIKEMIQWKFQSIHGHDS